MKKIAIILVLISTSVLSMQAQNFHKKLKKELQSKLGTYLTNGFEIQDPPMNNFGLGTCYKDQAQFANFECDMFNCIKKSEPSSFEEWKNMYGFAGVGSSQSSEKISTSIKSDFVTKLVLPKVFSILNLNAGLNKTKVVNSSLIFGTFYLRLLRKQPFQDFINGLEKTSRIKQFFLQGKLVITTGDVIIEKLSYDIEVKSDIQASLDAKLTDGFKVFSDESSFSFKLTRSGDKKYSIEITKPVIIAVLTQIQSGPGILCASAGKEYLVDMLKNYSKPTKKTK